MHKVLYGMYKSIWLEVKFKSNDVMFQISLWKRIKSTIILHHFNVRLETSTLPHLLCKDSIYWKIIALQNRIWPWSPSLRSSMSDICVLGRVSNRLVLLLLFLVNTLYNHPEKISSNRIKIHQTCIIRIQTWKYGSSLYNDLNHLERRQITFHFVPLHPKYIHVTKREIPRHSPGHWRTTRYRNLINCAGTCADIEREREITVKKVV